MTRAELEHIIRASADITDPYEFVIIGASPPAPTANATSSSPGQQRQRAECPACVGCVD